MAVIRTESLHENALDCAVSMCKPMGLFVAHGLKIGQKVAPTKIKAQADAIIAQANLVITIDGVYRAAKKNDDGTLTSMQFGQSEVDAAMRCYVHSHFGDEINIPDFLLQEDPEDELVDDSPAPPTQAVEQPEKPPLAAFEAIPSHAIKVHGFEEVGASPEDSKNHRALRDALRLMIDATGRHADVPLEEARQKAIQALAKVEAESSANNTLSSRSLLHKLGIWLCSR
jgi:hypothetical protein